MQKYFLHVEIPSSLPLEKFDLEIIELFRLAMRFNVSPSIAGDDNCRHIVIESTGVFDEHPIIPSPFLVCHPKVGSSNPRSTA